jgi:hypothetical protein
MDKLTFGTKPYQERDKGDEVNTISCVNETAKALGNWELRATESG